MPDPTAFDQPPRRALAALTPDDQAAWHLRYCPQEGLEMRARLVLETTERLMRETGQEVTIHALWVELADRAADRDKPDV